MKLIIGGSLFFSIWQSVLLWNKRPGISAILFIVPLLCYFIFFLNKNKRITNKKGLLWGIPIICLSITYFIFDNGLFQVLNGIAICMLWLIMCIDSTVEKFNLIELIGKMFGLAGGAFEHIEEASRGGIKLLKQDSSEEKSKKAKMIIKALVITIPVVLIVIILLSSADSIFSNMFSGVGDLLNQLIGDESIPATIARIIFILMFFFYMIGFMHNLAQKKEEQSNVERKSKKLDVFTTQIMLGILNVIYILFCIIQVVYLFIKTGIPNEMTYAEYARQGFFQLMIVTFINFAILLWIHIREKEHLTKFQNNFIKTMEAVMEICTQIIIISAFYRMFLYEQAYGYTYLRLFVYFILIAEFIFMICVLVYTIGKKINLIKAGLTIGVTVYVVLNFINVDALIAKNNINRYFMNPQDEFDFSYLKAYTGFDAVPEIKRLLNSEDEKLRDNVMNYLRIEKMGLVREDTWCEFNLSRQTARDYLEEIEYREEDYENYREEEFVEFY